MSFSSEIVIFTFFLSNALSLCNFHFIPVCAYYYVNFPSNCHFFHYYVNQTNIYLIDKQNINFCLFFPFLLNILRRQFLLKKLRSNVIFPSSSCFVIFLLKCYFYNIFLQFPHFLIFVKKVFFLLLFYLI